MSYPPYQYPPPGQYGGYPPPPGAPEQQPPYGQPQTHPPHASGYAPPPGAPPAQPGGYNPSYGGASAPPTVAHGSGYAPPPGPPPPGYPAYGGGPPAPPSGYGSTPPAFPPAPSFPGAPQAPQYPPPAPGAYAPSYATPGNAPPAHPSYNPSYMAVPPAGHVPPAASPAAHVQPPYGQTPTYGGAPQYAQNNAPMYLGVPIPPPPPHPPSTTPLPGFDAHKVAEAARKAMKGFGTNERALTEAIAPLDALQVEAVKRTFESTTGKGLIREVESEVSGYYEHAVRAKLLGPVLYDCWLLERGASGAGTDETVLTEILLDRTNAEIQILKAAFQAIYRRDVASVIRGELTSKTERLFNMALAGNRDVDGYPDQARVLEDVRKIYEAGKGRMGTDEITISSIIVTRSPSHLRAVVTEYGRTHGLLSKAIKSEFSGHMEEALVYIVKGYEGDGAGIDRDVALIEESMSGMGTKDEKLIMRIMRAHWNKPRFDAIKAAYERKERKPLANRVKGEISGDYRDFMVAVITSR